MDNFGVLESDPSELHISDFIRPEDGRFIVLAVNNFEAMKQALIEVTSWADREPDSEHGLHLDGCAIEGCADYDELDDQYKPAPCDCGRQAAINQARQVLANLEEKK